MLRKLLIVPCAMIFGTLIGSSIASAQAPPPVERPRTATTAAPQEYRVKQILGTKVNIQGNLAIGSVDDIVFGDDGYVEYLIVLNQGKLVTVPWEAAKFNFEQRTATVNLTQQQFEVIPTYTVEKYPSFYTPTYRTEIYKYYGLTPRERRLERKELRRP